MNVFVSGGGAASVLTTSATGASASVNYIGFGETSPGIAGFISPVTLTPAQQAMAVTMPASGKLSSFAANYLTGTVTGISNGTVYAALLADANGTGTFTLVPGSTLPVATGLSAATTSGTLYSASKALNARITQGTRLIVAYYLTDSGAVTAGSVTGYASASFALCPARR